MTRRPEPSLLMAMLQALGRQWLLLTVLSLLGLGVGAGAFAAWPRQHVATALVRVGTIMGARPVVSPPTVAEEAHQPSFQEAVRSRAGAAGQVEARALFRTQLVSLRALAREPGAAEKLAAAAASLVVEEQNALIQAMVDAATSRLGRAAGTVVMVEPVLSRPAVQVGQVGTATRAGPGLQALLALGLVVGLAVGLVAASVRETRRAQGA